MKRHVFDSCETPNNQENSYIKIENRVNVDNFA